MRGHKLFFLMRKNMSSASLNFQTPSITSLPQKRKKINYAPSYLYQKGNIFYFRYKFSPKEKEHFQHSEFRISLQTGFVQEAKKLARRLHSKIEGLIMDNKEKIDYSELRKKIAIELRELLALYPVKNPPSLTEIKNRMDITLQKFLNQMDTTLYQPPKGYAIANDDKLVQISAEQTLEQSFFLQKLMACDPKSLLQTYFPNAIFELLQEKIFTPDELTEANIPIILNEYHKLQLTINRIQCEREKGNFGFERQFITPTTTINQNPTQPLPTAQKTVTSPMLFDALKVYIDEKLRVKSWTERT